MTNNELLNLVANFETDGELFVKGSRNTIKLFTINGLRLNIKSFRKPGFIKKIIYKYFRISKAKRSFEFGNKLLEKGF
ncbi:MAG: Kdo domain containing protein, partial [Flavobacterium sp.]|nr:Kdo domain containing protein [Flavobacterium sp.]